MPYSEAENEYVDEELTKPFKPQTLQPAAAPKPGQSGGIGGVLGGLGNISSLYKMGEKGLPFLENAASGLGGLFSGAGGAAGATGAAEGAAALGAAEGAAGGAAAAGGLESLLALFALSDKRAKENIEPIGELFDGQKVYRYNYKEKGLAPRKGYQPGGEVTENVPEGYLDFVSRIESGGNPTATNPLFPTARGGPEGRFQFTRDTWLDLARNDPRFEGKSEDEILAARRDPVVSALYATRYGHQNAPVLRAAGLDPTQENLALAHMQGPGGARALLSDPSANVVDALLPVYGNNRERVMQVVSQNRGNMDMSAGDFASHLLRRGPAQNLGLGAAAPAASAEGNVISASNENIAPSAPPEGGLVPPARREAAQPEEKDWLRERLNKNEYWMVPLLTGLGTMASSPSRYLGASILQGLMGAGQAYQNQLTAEGLREKTAAETGRVRAATGLTEAQTQTALAAIAATAESPDRRTVRIYRNGRFMLIPREEFANNPSEYALYLAPYTPEERARIGGQQPSQGGPAAGGPSEAPPPATQPPAGGRPDATPMPPPTPPTARSSDPVAAVSDLPEETRNLADAELRNARAQSINELTRAVSAIPPGLDVFTNSRARASSAASALPDRLNLAKEFMSLPDEGIGALGRQTQFTTPILAWVNSTLSTFGVKDPRNPDRLLQLNPERLASLEAAEKETIQSGLRQQGESGSRAARELDQILAGTANTRMSPETVRKILANNFSAEQRAIDLDNFTNLWRSYLTQRGDGRTGASAEELKFTGPQVEREFYRIYGGTFNKEKEGIEKIFESTFRGQPLINHIIATQGRPSQGMVDYFNREFADQGGARLLRYFYGR